MVDDGEEEIGMLCSHDEISQSGRLNWCYYCIHASKDNWP